MAEADDRWSRGAAAYASQFGMSEAEVYIGYPRASVAMEVIWETLSEIQSVEPR